MAVMETKNIILKLRTQNGMSQDELAEKIMVTRQASEYGIRYHGLPEGEDASFFLCKELISQIVMRYWGLGRQETLMPRLSPVRVI